MFLEDIGLEEPGSAKLIRSAYKLLNLDFLTAGVKEVRAWTIPIGSLPQAAGVIHTDFEKVLFVLRSLPTTIM